LEDKTLNLFEDYEKQETETANWNLKEILTHPNISLSLILIFFFEMFNMMNNPILEPELQSKVCFILKYDCKL